MNADLPSLDQLRSNAAECIRLAEAARTSQHKSLFIEMAERWLTLAEHAEKTAFRVLLDESKHAIFRHVAGFRNTGHLKLGSLRRYVWIEPAP